jgi:hypothetical protein
VRLGFVLLFLPHRRKQNKKTLVGPKRFLVSGPGSRAPEEGNGSGPGRRARAGGPGPSLRPERAAGRDRGSRGGTDRPCRGCAGRPDPVQFRGADSDPLAGRPGHPTDSAGRPQGPRPSRRAASAGGEPEPEALRAAGRSGSERAGPATVRGRAGSGWAGPGPRAMPGRPGPAVTVAAWESPSPTRRGPGPGCQ